MALTKVQKQKAVDELKERIGRQKSVVFASITGLKVKDLANLRKEAKKKDCELKVAKKTLIQMALKGKGIEIDKAKLQGEIALGFGYKDEMSPFKILYNFSKENENLEILGGLFGKEFLEKEKAIAIAQLPSRDELFAELAFIFKSPLSGFRNVLEGNIKGLLCVLKQAKA